MIVDIYFINYIDIISRYIYLYKSVVKSDLLRVANIVVRIAPFKKQIYIIKNLNRNSNSRVCYLKLSSGVEFFQTIDCLLTMNNRSEFLTVLEKVIDYLVSFSSYKYCDNRTKMVQKSTILCHKMFDFSDFE